ncbi:MAG: hypothetical protein QOD99_1060, partial [Chthoniobacter sp.]|jgi:hypothetical protein|nr:hypothetical protein [Chthoniobacter sp.]
VGDSISDLALKALTARSMGKTTTQDPFDNGLQSNIFGGVGSIHVTGDVNNARIHVLGAQFGSIGTLRIDGALRGGVQGNSGQIAFSGKLGSAIVGDIIGGAGAQSGSIVGNLNNANRPANIGSVHVLGSITGGTGMESGEIAAFSIASVRIDQDIIGNAAGTQSGYVFGATSLGSVKVGGSLRGGGNSSANIISNGTIGLVSIGGDVIGGAGQTSAEIFGTNIRSIQIGGHITGGDGEFSARVLTGTLNSLEVGGNIVGGAGDDSGQILSVTLNKAVIGGNVQGGGGSYSGSVLSGALGNVTVRQSLIGASGDHSGFIGADQATVALKSGSTPGGASIGTLHIAGDVKGGNGNWSGAILAQAQLFFPLAALSKLTIDGDLLGIDVNSANNISQSAYIEAGHIGSLSVHDVIAGSNSGAGGIANSGAIRATQDISTITISGNLTGTAENNAIISANGFVPQSSTAKTDLAIGTLTIGGTMTRAEILAGYNTAATSTNPRGVLTDGDAQIGTVRINVDMVASSIVAGASAGADAKFGTPDDAAGPDHLSGIFAKIAAVVIGGTAAGSATGTEHFGIVAQEVQAVSIGTDTLDLHPGPSNETATGVPITANFNVLEV